MGGTSQGILGVETPSATRLGGPSSAANLLSGTDRVGPIGMNTPSIPAEELTGGGAVDAQKILNYASTNSGKRLGTGECFALADLALRGAGAKSAADFGSISDDADYIWGSDTALSAVQPGDIIQFRNYKYVRKITVDNERETRETESEQGRPHHTGIVKTVESDGKITIWEQNVPTGTGSVRTFELFFKNSETTVGDTTTKVTVSGTVKFYRPQPRS